MAADCSHLKTCEMYALLKLSGTLKTWQARYCCADFEQCARFKLSKQGKRVPINLMPNGKLLRTRETSGPREPSSGSGPE